MIEVAGSVRDPEGMAWLRHEDPSVLRHERDAGNKMAMRHTSSRWYDGQIDQDKVRGQSLPSQQDCR